MLPEDFEHSNDGEQPMAFHDSIIPILNGISPHMPGMHAAVRLVSELITTTKLPQFESRTQNAYLDMLKRLGKKRVNNFGDRTARLVREAKAKLEKDVARETARLRESSSIDASLGGSHSNAL